MGSEMGKEMGIAGMEKDNQGGKEVEKWGGSERGTTAGKGVEWEEEARPRSEGQMCWFVFGRRNRIRSCLQATEVEVCRGRR